MMTMKNVLLWFVGRTVACRGAAAFITPDKASQPEYAIIGMSRDVYSESNFPRNENWGFWQNGRGGDRRIFDDRVESQRDSDQRRSGGYDYKLRGDYNDYYDGPDPAFGVREYQQQYREDFGRNSDGNFERREPSRGNFGRRNFDWRQEYYRDELRYPYNLNDDDTQRQRYETQNYDAKYRTEDFGRDSYGDFERQESSRGNSGRRSFDGREEYYRDEPRYHYDLQNEDDYRGQPQRYGDKDDYYGGSQRQQYENQNAYDMKRLPWYDGSQEREQEQYRPSEIVREEPFGFGAVERMAGRMIRPFEMIDRMMNNMMMDPFFSGFDMMNQMMDRFGFEMEARMNQDRSSIEGLLDDAHDCIRADPAVTELLGGRIQLGMPFAESSSSAVINGMERTRLEVGFLVSGSRGVGRARLLAEQGRISLLEVEVGGRITDVRVDERRIYNSRNDVDDEIIDANVVDKQVY
jgi:hypothetical protein